jgi:hypothetical protein
MRPLSAGTDSEQESNMITCNMFNFAIDAESESQSPPAKMRAKIKIKPPRLASCISAALIRNPACPRDQPSKFSGPRVSLLPPPSPFSLPSLQPIAKIPRPHLRPSTSTSGIRKDPARPEDAYTMYTHAPFFQVLFPADHLPTPAYASPLTRSVH